MFGIGSKAVRLIGISVAALLTSIIILRAGSPGGEATIAPTEFITSDQVPLAPASLVEPEAARSSPDRAVSPSQVAANRSEAVSPLGLGEFLVNDGYETYYPAMPPGDLEREVEILDRRLYEATIPAFDAYNDTGRYEVVARSGEKVPISASEIDDLVIAYRTLPQADEVRKIVLSEAEYPGVYALYRRVVFAKRQVVKNQHALAQASADHR